MNVAYIPKFHTSVVSFGKMQEKGVQWDTANSRLTYNDEAFCMVPKYHGQWVLEYNEPNHSVFAARSAKPQISTASGELWHIRLGHISPEAVAHLEKATTGAKVEGLAPSTNKCEVCSTTKAHKIISRRAPTHQATRPFEKVSWDLVEFKKGYNRGKWMLHFVCHFTHMHEVRILESKTQIPREIKRYTAFIQRRFNVTVNVVKSDNEPSLGYAYSDWIKDEGMTWEASAPYTPDQNGNAERAGGVITIRARSIAIHSGIPSNMWPELVQTAAYLLNRTPTRQLDWKTPLETLQNAFNTANPLPNIAHLKRIGCRAYPRVCKKADLSDKLAPRAHVGYLMGYDSSNIFRVWVPSERRVISSRDVIFDEDTSYDPKEKDLASQLRTDTTQIIEVIDVPEDEHYHQPHIQEDSESSTSDSENDLDYQQDDQEPKDVVEEEAWSSDESYAIRLATPAMTSATITPEPETPIAKQSKQRAPQDINLDIDESNIVDEPRHRKKSANARGQAHAALIATTSRLSSYYSSFAVGIFQKAETSEQLHRDKLPPPPKNWKELQKHPHKQGFLGAANKEYDQLKKRNTFRAVLRPRNVQILPIIWVFTYKFDTDGYLLKYKARLCVRGDLQPTSHEDNYAATLAARTFRMLMAITAAFDLEAKQMDAVNAFVNSQIDTVIYVGFPDGFRVPGMCLLLLRALYGLRQSPRLWHQQLSKQLMDIGLTRVEDEICVFTNEWLIVFFFVDDIVTLFSSIAADRYHQFESAIMHQFEFHLLGDLKWFLGIRVTRDRSQRKLWLCQDSYVEKIAKRYHLDQERRYITPAAVEELGKFANDCKPSEEAISAYQQRVGSLQYAAIITRPDASRIASKLAEFLHNPAPQHQDAVNRAIAYLYDTKTYAIEFSASADPDKIFEAYSDAAFGDCPTTRRSTEGYLFKLYNGPIDWKSTKQKSVTTSTTEAELHALSHAVTETFWWERIFKAIRFDPGHQLSAGCDNKQTIGLLTSKIPKFNTKLRHVDINHHWLRQQVQEGRIHINWVQTADMPADGLTKALPSQKHQVFIQQLGLVDISTILLK